jgi:hypothetical protein
MDSVVPLRLISYKAVSPLVTSMMPNPSVLLQYPMFFTMARVTVHRELSYSLSSGKKLAAIHASFLHGLSVYNKYGVFALYRGLPVYLGHSFVNTLLVHPSKNIKSKRLSACARIAADAAAYPLLLACTRMAAYTTEDSQWSFSDCLRNTVQVDGWIGLWSGALPFLMVSAYKELDDVLFAKVKNFYPKLDEADTAILGFLRVGLGAVITSPFLTMSTILRCQSNNDSLLKPTSFLQVFAEMPWKWNLLALSLVTALGAVNLALIHDKHKDEHENRDDDIKTLIGER